MVIILRKLVGLLVPIFGLLLVTTGLYLSHEHFERANAVKQPPFYGVTKPSEDAAAEPLSIVPSGAPAAKAPPAAATVEAEAAVEAGPAAATTTITKQSPPAKPSNPSKPSKAAAPAASITIKDGFHLNRKEITPYVKAIFDPESTDFDRLECPPINETRYDLLRRPRAGAAAAVDPKKPNIDFYFVLDLRKILPLLPRLIGSIVEAVRFLGPERCGISIVEGNSPDGTGDVLKALRPFMKQLGVAYTYKFTGINPKEGDRIKKLIELRNLAFDPMFDSPAAAARLTDDTTILFVNDVAACAEDLLELAYQRTNLGADMTCAMDWMSGDDWSTFYDVWVARTLRGDTFFRIPDSGSWDFSSDLFFNDTASKARFDAVQPFQVFACWNGAVAIKAAPIIKGLRFRRVKAGLNECFGGEPTTFCKDMHFNGYDKIAVVPSVNLEYNDEGGKRIKKLRGYVSDHVPVEPPKGHAIAWEKPPAQVKCMPEFHRQSWKPWNEALHESDRLKG